MKVKMFNYKLIMEIEKGFRSTFNLGHSVLKNHSSTLKPSTRTNLVNKRDAIKIKPEIIEFNDIEMSHKYQIPLHIRNQSRETQKIRIIQPVCPFFSVQCPKNPMTIAPGLAQKIFVYFQLQTTHPAYIANKDTYEEQLKILGNNFQKIISLKSLKPDFKLQLPNLFKLGVLKLSEQKQFTISMQNSGQSDIQIGLIQCSSPIISCGEEKIIAKKMSVSKLKIKVKPKCIGPIQQTIFFPNGHKIQVRGICTQDKVQILNERGMKFACKDFGYIFMGEKLNEKFYVVNSSPNPIQCLIKIFSKNIPDYLDIKIDETKKTFINRHKPTKLTEQSKKVNIKCQNERFMVEAFTEIENMISVQRLPSQHELELFRKQVFMEDCKNGQGFKSYSQNVETLYLKIVDVEKPIKIPLKFTPILPKIYINKNKFEFESVCPKKSTSQTFTIKNENEKLLAINFPKNGLFSIQGQSEIGPGQINTYTIIFRPLIPGQFSDNIKITIFNIWEVQLRMYGSCRDNYHYNQNPKRMMKLGSQRILKNSINTYNYLASERKKRKQKQYNSLLKTKLSEKLKISQRNDDIPIDLAFDSLENPKLSSKKFIIKPITSQLFFQKQKWPETSYHKKNNPQMKLGDLKLAEQLTISELGKVEVKCDEVDFGSIFINSFNERALVINNKNWKPIIVELNLGDHEYFCDRKVETKKIQAFGENKFLISLKPENLGHVRIPITYTINRNHVFEIDVIANVTLLNLGFSVKSLNFSFHKNQCEFEKVKAISVSNYGNAVTKFVISQPASKNFSIVSNLEDQIAPNAQLSILVKYRPTQSTEKGEEVMHTDKLTVKVIGGAQNIIRLKGYVHQPKFSLKQTEIYFPELFICTQVYGKLSLRNHSKVESAVKIQFTPPSLADNIIVDQMKFMMNAEQRKQICYQLHSSQMKQVRGNLVVTIRGSKIFKMPININFCYPKIDVVSDGVKNNDIDLGIVHILSNHIEKEIKVINRMKSEIKLEINKYCEEIDYNLEILTTNQTVELAIDKQNEGAYDKVIIKEMATANSPDKLAFDNSAAIQNTQKLTKILTLYPGVQTNFIIKFIPKILKQYHFSLPLYLHKATTDLKPIKQKIKCLAVEPLFYVNPYHLHFDNVILSDNEMGSYRYVEIVNPRDEQLNWEIEPLPEESVFYCLDKKGVLKPKQSKKLEVYFKPTQQNHYEERMKFFTMKSHKISVEIEISGVALAPRVYFNKNNLILPPVPLSIQSRSIIQLNNAGYETLTFTKWKINHQYPSVSINVNFIDGKTISLAKKKIRIQIIFKSLIPASFTTSLQLCDQYGQKISVPVSCTAENCLLTIYNYLDNNEKKKIVLDDVDNIIKVLVSQKIQTFDKDISVSAGMSATCNFIKKWCNFELNIEMEEFPKSIIDSRGPLLEDLVYRMSNGRQQIKKPIFTSSDKIMKMRETYQFYCDMIHSLKNDGAFLNQIRPQFLLNMNDYLLYLMDKNLILDTEETIFQILSLQSWTTLFYQIYKIYVEPSINEKFFGKLNKFQKSEKLPCSTVYSTPQIHILEYLNSFINDDKMYTFTEQSKIFEAIQKIIETTFGISLSEELSNLKLNTTSMPFHDFMITLSRFLHYHLQQFGLALYINPTDFFTMGPKQYLVFLVSLMSHLLPYQNFQLICFETAINEKSKKTIEIENPSKSKTCKYWVKVFGSDNFRPEFKEIELLPKQKLSIIIEYHCRGTENEEARMILVPTQNQQGFIPSHSLSFLLKNNVFSKTIVKKIKVKASLYEIKSITLPIQLPIEHPHQTEFMVKLTEHYDIKQQNNQIQSFYLLNPGNRSIKDGKDKCQIKFCSLSMIAKYCEISYFSITNSQYIFEIIVDIGYPNASHQIHLPSLAAQKEENIKIKIPKENNQLLETALKFHKEMTNKKKDNSKKQSIALIKKKTQLKKKIIYNAYFQTQGFINLIKDVCVFEGGQQQNNILEGLANFPRPYKLYSANLILEAENKKDIRKYQVLVHVSIKPKTIHLRSTIKARQKAEIILNNKIINPVVSCNKKLQCFSVKPIQDSNDFLATFHPEWIIKDQIKVIIENKQNFQTCIYKIKLEASKPDCVEEINLIANQIFDCLFQIDLNRYNLSNDLIDKMNIKTDLIRPHQFNVIKQSRKIIVTVKPSHQEGQWTIKLSLPTIEGYFEYKLNITNSKIIQLPKMEIKQQLFEEKKFTLPNVQFNPQNFQISYESEEWFKYELEPKNKKINPQKVSTSNHYFNIIFKPMKEINKAKKLHIKTNNQIYSLNIDFYAPALDPITVPLIKSQNIHPSHTVILINNTQQLSGQYEIKLKDSQSFKCDKSSVQIRYKQKIPLKLSYLPKCIGENIKTELKLRSQTLPDLTYLVEGVSIFQVDSHEIQIECYNNTDIVHSLSFTNNFPYKEKFRFEIIEPSDNEKLVWFNKGEKAKFFTEDIASLCSQEFKICQSKSQSPVNSVRIHILKGFEKKLVKEITIKFLIVKDLENGNYHWQCKARQTLYETIQLPETFNLKEIKADPEIKKCISYNSEEQLHNEIKLKFISLKPIKPKKYSLILIGDLYKYKITTYIKVTEPLIDDTILIRTDEIKETKTTVFRLTNIVRESAPYRAYFLNSYQQFEVEPNKGILESYGKTGTPICIKFTSETHNKRIQDKLMVETENMLWVFKVVGMQTKILKF